MSLKYKELENEVSSLEDEERASLALHLISSLDSGNNVNSEQAWIAEAEQRYKDGKIESHDAKDVFNHAVKKLND